MRFDVTSEAGLTGAQTNFTYGVAAGDYDNDGYTDLFVCNTKKNILYRVAGKGGRVNLIIDGYQHLRSPIYGGLTFTAGHDDVFTWHVQDVGMWVGLRAYIDDPLHKEFVAKYVKYFDMQQLQVFDFEDQKK